jgi:NAD(P)-dependent dehydrogenase (short-subunit alcohol dehydrogenase family)
VRDGIGANRGIDSELVRQLRNRGDEVEDCARRPAEANALAALVQDRVRGHPLDVTDPASVRALATALGDAAIDLVCNVAGVYGGPPQSLGQMAEDLALGDVATTYDVNAIGALRARADAGRRLGAGDTRRGRPRHPGRLGRVPRRARQPLGVVIGRRPILRRARCGIVHG